jgi:Carboxypeptidase regulatory-like domain/Cleaved Adhesin Domain
MLTPTPSRPGRSRKRRWLSGAVTLLAALAAVVGLSGLQAPGASASVARAAAAGHPAIAAHSSAGHAAAAPKSRAKLKPVVRTAVRHDTSQKMRNVRPDKNLKTHKLKALPLRSPPHSVSGATSRTADVQRSKTVTTDALPSFGQNFEGVSNLNGVFPPDTNMAVGPNDIVQTVNFSFAVYNKSGGTLLGPETLGTLWQGFGGACDPATDPSAANGGDVVALYDEQANRFIVTQLAYPQLTTGSGGFHECIAVSQTGDPTGAWFRYDFLASDHTLNDYPKLGVWPDAYYMSQNDFPNDGNSNQNGVTVTAFDRAQMLAGQQATSVSFTTGSQYANLLPSNTEGGALGVSPPDGAPNPYFMSCDAQAGGPCSSDQMDEWDFHVDFSNPASSTFGNNGDPTTTMPVAEFNSNLCNFSGNCIPQPGTTQGLDALSDRLMYQSAYRNLAGGTQAVVLNQSVNVSTNGGNQAGVRWYELTNTGSGWQVGQQGTYAPDTDNRWMGSANIDASGDIAIGYSVASASTFPSIRVAGRLAGDPAGQLSQGEQTLIAGTGSQTGADIFGRGRWGDYSAMQVDPTDSCTFWYTTEYIQTTGGDPWQTRVGSFKFPSCTAGPHGTVTGTVTNASNGNPIAGATVSTSTVSTTTDSQGHYTMVLPAGSVDVTYSAFGFTSKTESGVQVTDGGTTTQDEALTPAPSVHVTGTVTDGSGHGWPLHASIDITGDPNGPVWTNPATGQYSVDLPANSTEALTVTTDLPGYQTVNDTVTTGTGDLTHNISVPVNPACTAPGYHLTDHTPVFSESFDGSAIPAGWTVTDNNGSGHVWQIGDPENRGNLTGGSGNFADINSDFYGPGNTQDTTLTTPTMDLSNVGNPILRFHNDYFGFSGQTGAVDVSTDGGQTWTNIWSHGNDSVRGPDLETVHVPQAAGKSTVQFRYHFTATFGFWWEVDDVTVQDQTCDPTPGGLVVGQVTDANTSKGLDGATVTSTDNPSDKGTTALSGDPGIGDGYYWLFSSLTGSHQFTAAKPPYQSDSQTVNVAADSATRADCSLKAAVLSVTPASSSSSQVLGNTTTQTLTFKNTGTAPANVKLQELGGSFGLLGPQPPLAAPGSVKFTQAVDPGPTSYTVDRGGDGGDAQAAKARALAAPDSPGWQSAAPVPQGIVRYAYATCPDAPNSFYVISGVATGGASPTPTTGTTPRAAPGQRWRRSRPRRRRLRRPAWTAGFMSWAVAVATRCSSMTSPATPGAPERRCHRGQRVPSPARSTGRCT